MWSVASGSWAFSAARWLSLMRMPSERSKRWFVPPPVRTAYFSSTRRPGVVLRVSRRRHSLPSSKSDDGRGRAGDAAEVREEVQGDALGAQDRPERALDGRDGVAGRDAGAFGLQLGPLQLRVHLREGRFGQREAGEDAFGLGGDGRAARLVGRYERVCRYVICRVVLGKCGLDELAGSELGRAGPLTLPPCLARCAVIARGLSAKQTRRRGRGC